MEDQRAYALVTWRKAGVLRFLGHLDVARTFDRAVRRARLPVVYSKGFSPRAGIRFADPLPVGAAGENELCVIELARPMAADDLQELLSAQMPDGLDVTEVRILRGRRRASLSHLSRAEYEVELAPLPGVSAEALAEAVRCVRDAGELPIVRETKTRSRKIDIRPHIYALYISRPNAQPPGLCLYMSLGYGQERLVKPTEVLGCIGRQLTELTGKQIELEPRLITRLGLY